MLSQKKFAKKVFSVIKNDTGIIGLAAASAWITVEMDEYTDLDLILVTIE